MKNIIIRAAAGIAGMVAAGTAYAGVYIPFCSWQWVLGPYGWYQVWACY